MRIVRNISTNMVEHAKKLIKKGSIIEELVNRNPKIFVGYKRKENTYILLIKNFIDIDDEEINYVCINFTFSNCSLIGNNGNQKLFKIDEDWQNFSIDSLSIHLFENSYSFEINFQKDEHPKMIEEIISNSLDVSFSNLFNN